MEGSRREPNGELGRFEKDLENYSSFEYISKFKNDCSEDRVWNYYSCLKYLCSRTSRFF